MRFQLFKSALVRAGLAATALLLGTASAHAQQAINLTAAPTTLTMADGSQLPMWGYSCGALVTGSTATCAALNPASVTTAATATTAAVGTWSPVLITVPTGQDLSITLSNNLSFSTGTGTNNIPTSLTIVGQLGGGLGGSAAAVGSPPHQQLGVSWSTANTPGGTNPTFTPPGQASRVQSFTTEVVVGTPATLCWGATCPTPSPALRPGTYLIESGTHPSIQGPMGLYGVLVVTAAPTSAGSGTAYPAGAVPGSTAVSYDDELAVLFSEIDPMQNGTVDAAVRTAGFSETMVWSGQPGGCGNISSGTYLQCYPPAVNYTPTYFLINGVGFNRTNPAASIFPLSNGGNNGTSNGTLVRMVNAGLRMHVPMIVGAQTTIANNGSTTTPAGMTLVAEDGNPVPGQARVQSEVFMAAGKTYDVKVNVPTAALPIYDRELSLSGNATDRDAGMLAYLSPTTAASTALTAALAASGATSTTVTAVADTYNVLVAGQTYTLSDPSKGVMANDTNVSGVTLLSPATNGTVLLNRNGTFTYVPGGTATSDTFSYCANGTVIGGVCSSGISATVTLGAMNVAHAGVTCTAATFTSNLSSYLAIKTPGLLAGCTDGANLPLSVVTTSVSGASGTLVVNADANGGFTATFGAAGSTAGGIGSFNITVKNSQGQTAVLPVNVIFPAGSGLKVTVLDPNAPTLPIGDYRWIIEEDRTFYINPKCVSNPPPAGAGCITNAVVPTLGVNFHSSYMPFVAQGCTGPLSCETGQSVLGTAAVCDVGNGNCRAGAQKTVVMPGQVHLDPTKRYFLSILPGDAANPFNAGFSGTPCTYDGSNTQTCVGHGMGGAPIGIDPNTLVQASSVTVWSQPSPYQTAQLAVFVYEDDFPLNGEHDAGGGVDVLSPNEPGLGGFEIVLWDAMGGNGDFTGQMTHDMFNQPLSNGLAGTIDPATGFDACPIANNQSIGQNGNANGITGRIVTCPTYEADGKTLSPLAGSALIKNLMPMRVGVVATPAADRIARGEEWLQTNTLDGQKAHDAFAKIGEPAYFQEFGPANYHVSVGFANPKIINSRLTYVCNGTDANAPNAGSTLNCTNTLSGKVTGQRLSRTPDERLYSSGTHDAFYWTQCYVSVGDPDGEDFAFTKCNADGTFSISGLPDGDWRITTFDQWNDQLVDGLSTPVRLGGTSCSATGANPVTCNPAATPNNVNMEIAATQWQTNLYTRTFIDDAETGLPVAGATGIPFANVAVRLRDGSLENLQLADFSGTANFNETFPLFSWYVVETDVTRYKNTGTHVVYDAGGPADGSAACGTPGYPPCGSSTIGKNLANTAEQISLPTSPTNLRVPGSVYCAVADCNGKSILNGPASSDPPSVCSTTTAGVTSCSTQLSTGRIDNPWYGGTEGWQGFPGQNSFLEFGKAPYVAGENGGIVGHVVYASTRPFDDPQLLVQTQWEPLVPHVMINLYQEGYAADGITPTLRLVDTTSTSSFDDFAQGFHLASDGTTKIPNMNCPGQGAATGVDTDLFYFSLYQQPNYLDLYNSQHGGPAATPLPYNAQFKCYDGMHNWNQLQPAPYDGQYQFPSVVARDPVTGKPTATNCKICSPDPAATPDLYSGVPMLPPGKYVVEVVVPPGMELVKEEDKNILIGDNYIGPAAQEFGGLGNVYILPDQASIAGSFGSGSGYNANNPNDPTQNLGATPLSGIVPGFVPEPVWPCVGELRTVPDYISLFPGGKQMAPFAGAQRHLCDRKEVTLSDQMHAIAKFYVYTSAHVASKFTGGITDDYTSEFDPFSPQFGEKFAPPDLPVSVKDWTGAEVNRVYADHWGAYDGMTYSTWEVNPPNPTGYAPSMMVLCMNDPGPIIDTSGTASSNPTFGQPITDPLFTQGYSQFCYELPFMPGTTQYLDTPVVPTSAFAGAGYNNVDCYEPDSTPAIKEVDGDGIGPWISATGSGHPITITALGDVMVPNYAYSGPSANVAPYNTKTIKRHYGFGATQGTGSVTIGGVTANVTGWSDSKITVNLPSSPPNCAVQQQSRFGGSTAKCGQLVVTTGAGRQSVESVTVTVGGKLPTHIAANASVQAAIDKAAPGDLLIVDPTCTTTATGAIVACTSGGIATQTYGTAAHNEILLMWKPVRLQGVGAVSSIINANTQPAGKLDPWRASVNCLFGLSLNGQPNPSATGVANAFDPSGRLNCPNGQTGSSGKPSATGLAGTGPDGYPWYYFNPTTINPQVDRLPLESALGWDATLSGNLAELLQEPSLMGALEGAGITVLSKGVYFPTTQWDPTLTAGFPTGTVLFTDNNTETYCSNSTSSSAKVYPSNFQCNPSSIDGLGITDASQGGGGIFVHAWGHNLQIANNRVYNNTGTLSGGINIGQGEFPTSYVVGSATNAAPGSCESAGPTGAQLPYCHNTNVNMHNNWVALNNSTGDELFSATPAGAGGVSICTGSDYYKFNYNWVCGNLSSGDGGGFGHLGFSKNGDIEHNSFLFNQSTNPTISTNGGGLIIMGTPDADPTCGATTDQDCVSPLGALGPSDGVGPGLTINANLIQGNSAESGSGGGIAFQNVNGSDVVSFPTTPANWHHVVVTNNIIVDNVAGWDGGGVSLLDALNLDLVNNTISSNVTTASAGVLTNTLGAPLASTQNCPPGSTNAAGYCTAVITTSTPQAAGMVSINNSAILLANLPATITCPPGHFLGAAANNASCRQVSYPLMDNNLFWQNTAYYVGVGNYSAQFQQNSVTLYDGFTTTAAVSQATTGQCLSTPASYWDIGVRGDTGPGNHSSGVNLSPNWSLLTNAAEAGAGTNVLAANPLLTTQFCVGSRQPPEACATTGSGTGISSPGGCGYSVPPGISDATVPNPIFNLTPVATVDEGNNWVNMRWGPLSLTNPTVTGTDGNYGAGPMLGNYAQTAGSPVINYIPATLTGGGANPAFAVAPSTDFFGNPRKGNNRVDVGAVEYQAPAVAVVSVTPTSLTFNTVAGTTSAAQTLTLSNSGGVAFTGTTLTFAGAGFARGTGATGGAGSCGAVLGAGATCTINVVFSPAGTATGTVNGSLAITGSVAVTGSPVTLTGNVVAPVRTFTVSPATLAFGNWFSGTRSNSMTVTVTNTGNAPLAGFALAFGGGTPQPFARTTGSGTGTCGGGNLATGASCTINVRFTAPTVTATTAYSRTLTVSYTAATTTSAPVTLTGSAVTTQATLGFAAPGVTLAANVLTGSTVVTVTNQSATTSVAITADPVSGSGFSLVPPAVWAYGDTADTCIPSAANGAGINLAPGASCTVTIGIVRLGAAGARPATVTFTDTATGSPQAVAVPITLN